MPPPGIADSLRLNGLLTLPLASLENGLKPATLLLSFLPPPMALSFRPLAGVLEELSFRPLARGGLDFTVVSLPNMPDVVEPWRSGWEGGDDRLSKCGWVLRYWHMR